VHFGFTLRFCTLAQGDTLKNIRAGATPQNTLTKKIGSSESSAFAKLSDLPSQKYLLVPLKVREGSLSDLLNFERRSRLKVFPLSVLSSGVLFPLLDNIYYTDFFTRCNNYFKLISINRVWSKICLLRCFNFVKTQILDHD